MPVLTIPNIFINNVSPVDATTTNANNTAIASAVNSIDKTNIGAVGLVASNVKPTTAAEATFGGSLAYTFPTSILASVLGLNNVMSPQFGAKGDGTTDDTTAIQNAIAAGSTFFPPGTYIVSAEIPIPQNRYICGVPGQSIIKQKANANLGAIFETGNYTVAGGLSFIDWENITIEGLVFDGNGTNQAGYTSMTPQCFAVLYGSNIHVRFCRFQNCGAAVASNLQIPTGLLIGCSLENPPTSARLTANFNEYLNCYGVASWLTNAKGGFNNPVSAPDTYGNPGLCDVSHQSFYFCRHGLYVEDRSNGWVALGITYWGDASAYLANGGNAVSVLFSSHGKVGVTAKYCASALVASGSPAKPCSELTMDVDAENCAFAATRLVGTAPFSATTNGALTGGVSNSIPVMGITNGGTVVQNAWVLIIDAVGGDEWVQASGVIAGGAFPINGTVSLNHAGGVAVQTDTGMHHHSGVTKAKNCGSTGDNAGLYTQQCMDSVLDIVNYDTRQYGSPLNQAVSGITQYYGAKLNTSTRVTIRGNGYANRDTAFFDDGTNTNCEFVGMLGSINDNGVRQLVHAIRYSPQDTTRPSIFMGSGAPSNNLGKNGDIYYRADGTPGLFATGTVQYVKAAGAWAPGRIAAAGRFTGNGDGATTTFSAAHGLGASPNHVEAQLFANPGNASIAAGCYVGWSNTNVTVTFITAPPMGVNNVAFDWAAWI